MPSSGRCFSQTRLRHLRGKLFHALVHVGVCTCAAPLYGDFWPHCSCSFCRSVSFPWCSCVHRAGRWHGRLFCVRNAGWEVTRSVTDSLSIPVLFHSCVDVCISHCSHMFCLSVQTWLAWLITGQCIVFNLAFRVGADFDWKHNVAAHSAGPNLDVSREWSSQSKKKKTFPGQQL